MVEDSENIFTELISFIKNGRTEFKKTIADQEKAKVTEAVGVREQLEQNLTQLRKIKNEMEYLSRTQDHVHFLQVTSLDITIWNKLYMDKYVSFYVVAVSSYLHTHKHIHT